MLDDNNFLALRPEWILRNDGDKVILYLMSNSSCKYLILDPETAVIVTFLKGRQRLGELAQDIRYVFDLPTVDQARWLLGNVVELLNEDGVEKVAALEEPAPWRVDYRTLDFVVSRSSFRRERRLATPLSLMVYFSSRCQTTCTYCYADLANMHILKHLPLNRWLPILDDAKALDIRMIELTGGDPLGRSDSLQFLLHLLGHGFLFMVSTKCYVSENAAARLVDAGFNHPVNGVSRDFQVSLDSPDPSTVKMLVGSSDYLRRASDSIQNLIRAGISPRVKAVVTPLNYRHVRELVRIFAARGVKDFQFANYARSHYRHHDGLFLSDEMKRETAELLSAAASEWPQVTIQGDSLHFAPPATDDQRRREQWAARAACSAGRTNLGIAPDGQAVLCEQLPLTEPYFVGDLTKQSILEVWNSSRLQDFVYPPRSEFAGTPCQPCEEFERCVHDLGYCFRDSLFAYGKLRCPPPLCPYAPAGSPRTV